jgi:hypothetical protein
MPSILNYLTPEFTEQAQGSQGTTCNQLKLILSTYFVSGGFK